MYEEYLIYDAISMVGSVGGTLGMCIGFSFTGIISFLMKILQQGISIIKSKLSNEKNDISYNRSKSTEIFSGGSPVQYVKEMESSIYLKSETYHKDKQIIEEKLNAINAILMEHKNLLNEKTLKKPWL